MGFRVSLGVAFFFTGIVVVLFTRSESKTLSSSLSQSSNVFHTNENERINLKPNYWQLDLTDENNKSPGNQQKEVNLNCGPLPNNSDFQELPVILSPDIFAQTDLLDYIIDKTITISPKSYPYLQFTISDVLKNNLLPSCYIPYAKLLSSFLRCWIHIYNAYSSTQGVRRKHFINEDSSNALLPPEISWSPALSKLFSSDIFHDPKPPRLLFHKFLNMTSREIMILKIQLKSFIQKWRGKSQKDIPFSDCYVWFLHAIFKLLLEENALENFKRDMVEIQRII